MIATGSIWYVIYMTGHIAGVIGPLPLTMLECKQHEISDNLNVQKHVIEGKDIHGQPLTEMGRTTRMECQQSVVKPVISPEYAKDAVQVTQ